MIKKKVHCCVFFLCIFTRVAPRPFFCSFFRSNFFLVFVLLVFSRRHSGCKNNVVYIAASRENV